MQGFKNEFPTDKDGVTLHDYSLLRPESCVTSCVTKKQIWQTLITMMQKHSSNIFPEKCVFFLKYSSDYW